MRLNNYPTNMRFAKYPEKVIMIIAKDKKEAMRIAQKTGCRVTGNCSYKQELNIDGYYQKQIELIKAKMLDGTVILSYE